MNKQQMAKTEKIYLNSQENSQTFFNLATAIEKRDTLLVEERGVGESYFPTFSAAGLTW